MKFSKTHEWVKTEEEIASVGISDYAQKELGDIVYVELPAVGHAIEAGDMAVVLESTKAAVDIYSPISGEVVAVNEELRTHPEKINLSAEDQGWLFKLRLKRPQELATLMDATSYRAYIGI